MDPPEGEEAQESADTDEGIQTLADLAKTFEVDEETLAQHVRVKGRDGQEVPLSEVIEAYRTPPPDAQELSQARERIQALSAKEADWHQAAEELRQTAQHFAQQLKASEPNWEELRRTNPSEYLSTRLEWQDRRDQLERAARQFEENRQRMLAENEQKLAETRRQEALKLKSLRSEWSDQAVFERDLGKTAEYLQREWKLSAEDVNALSDHRDWAIAHKAMLWDELQKQKPETLRRVRNLPKALAPGVPRVPERPSARAQKEESKAVERLKQSGSKDDAVAAIAARLRRSSASRAGRSLAAQRRV